MTDPVLTDLQLKILGVIQEFNGLGGIAAFRLVKESGTKSEYVDECLKYFKDLKLVQEKRAYPSSFWRVTEQGERVLNGHAPEIVEVVPEPMLPEASVPSDAAVPEEDIEAEEEYDLPPVEAAAPDEPDTWYICDRVDEKGKKCGRRFTSQHGLMTHEAMVHKPENAKAPGTPTRDTWQKYRCNVEGCGFTTGNLQGLKHHKTSKHGKQVDKAKEGPSGPFPCTEEGCTKVFDKAQGLLMHRQRVHLKTVVSPGPRKRRSRPKASPPSEPLPVEVVKTTGEGERRAENILGPLSVAVPDVVIIPICLDPSGFCTFLERIQREAEDKGIRVSLTFGSSNWPSMTARMTLKLTGVSS